MDEFKKTNARRFGSFWGCFVNLLKAGVNEMLEERESRYGSFARHALVAQKLKEIMKSQDSWEDLSPDKAEALEMIAHKIARILNGDPDYKDNWDDIAGYSVLVSNSLYG